ncbi:hypothetical protein Goshw_002886 [Gossypium schwendimanii]|uniref:Uncharacterized protein n=1 Tax=Gossypium schwendimanii TaxID=34291 RepID=A0A7J9L0K4_GOSSC|nr:hypothetical protein [Gossypium schwendimanii]
MRWLEENFQTIKASTSDVEKEQFACIHLEIDLGYDYLPSREPFLTLELATSPNYMDWFMHNDKSYLFPALERSRQRLRRRPR